MIIVMEKSSYTEELIGEGIDLRGEVRQEWEHVLTPEALRFVSEKLIEKRKLVEEVRELRQMFKEEYTLEEMVSKSPKMAKVFDLIKALAETDSGVLITGETGTGKELVARAIHSASARADRPSRRIRTTTWAASSIGRAADS